MAENTKIVGRRHKATKLAVAGASVDCNIELIESFDRLLDIADSWRALELKHHSSPSFFQSADWCLRWFRAQQNAGKAPIELRVYAFWKGEQLVGIVPLMIDTKYGVKRLSTIGFPQSLYSNCVIDDENFDHAMLKQWAKSLKDTKDFDCVCFDDLPVDSPLCRALVSICHTYNNGGSSMVMDLTRYADEAALTASMSKNARKHQKRRLLKLEEIGKVSLDIYAAGTSEFDDAKAKAFQWKREWLKALGKPLTDKREKLLDRLLSNYQPEEVCQTPAGENGTIAHVLSVDGVPIAIEIGFVLNAHYYSYLGAYDADWSKFSPGKIQIQLSKVWSLKNGIKTFDFLGSAADYKLSLSNDEIDLISLTLPISNKGTVYAVVWLQTLRPASYNLFECFGPQVKAPLVKAKNFIESLVRPG